MEKPHNNPRIKFHMGLTKNTTFSNFAQQDRQTTEKVSINYYLEANILTQHAYPNSMQFTFLYYFLPDFRSTS